jgi:hypothetical protein
VCIAWMMSRSPDLACFQVKIYISHSHKHIAGTAPQSALKLTVDCFA